MDATPICFPEDLEDTSLADEVLDDVDTDYEIYDGVYDGMPVVGENESEGESNEQ
jgi:hypothetical protein